jgi:acetyl/propionyl-CoA carboxylase alpha subunit
VKILIANRGEIARRIIRTANRLGHETVAVYADPDATAPHVREATQAVHIGPAPLAESYLSAERILAAAASSGASAINPGYGFLSENAGFARAVIEAGLIWIGPKPDAIDRMGSKIEARRLAAEAGVPVIPGFDESQNDADLRAAAERIGWPILVKASAGGGGKGIRIARSGAEFDQALSEARSEAARSFGDDAVIVERYIERPRHIEVQILGDRHGEVAELGTRECSVQRRYQKVIEEAPAPNLADGTRHGLRASAVALARSIGYDSAGTVEFIVDDETGDHFFLEMNTRLQVEHPVTELVTGVDLVEAMIRVAQGEALPVPAEPTFTGHAIECRINAEDPDDNFAPRTGAVHQLVVPEGVRWDAAIEAGDEISPFYDSMIAKLIVHGPDRAAATERMRGALERLIIGPLVTNSALHRWVLGTPEFIEARLTTRFLDETDRPGPDDELAASAQDAAAGAWVAAERAAVEAAAVGGGGASPWQRLPTFSLTPRRPQHAVGLRDADGEVHEVVPSLDPPEPGTATAVTVDRSAGRVAVNVGGRTFAYEVPTRTERWAPARGSRSSGAEIVAPFPAVVAEVNVSPGDEVAADQVLVVIEAMKMLHPLAATGNAVVDQVLVTPGDQVESNQPLITFATGEDQ